ncbi:SAM50-like protein SpAC17C9.06 [Lachancea thermotolerans]
MDLSDFSKELQKDSESSVVQRSSLKPLYFTSISVDGDNGSSPLSNTVYNSVLEPVLVQPLQTLDQSLSNFAEIKKKLIYTGLFRDVKISLDNEVSSDELQSLPKDLVKGYALEMPIPTIARIRLTPINLNRASLTSFTGDTLSSMGGRYSVINNFGKAEVLTLQGKLAYQPFQSTFDEKVLEAKLLIPLQKNPSVKAVFDANYANIDLNGQPFIEKKDQHRQRQVSVNVGVQKQWVNIKTGLAPVLYNGFSVVARNLDEVRKEASEAIRQFDAPFVKNSFVSQLLVDNRKFFGLFPASGLKFSINNEYVLSESFDKKAGTAVSQNEGFDKLAVDFEAHRAFFGNKIINSLELACGGIFSAGKSSSLVHHIDKFYLGGMSSLKGFERNSVGQHGGKLFYKLGLASSFKLPNTPANSPLRLQFFFNAGDVQNKKPTQFSCASSSGVSLLYKSSLANMDLTYAFPLTNRGQDIQKPGFSFGVSLSLY